MTIFPTLDVHSRTIRVEARVPNRDHRLKPGFYASVQVPLAHVPGIAGHPALGARPA